MRNKMANSIIGILFIAVGVGFLGNIFDWWEFSPFFNGWWTLFIIIPSLYSILRGEIHTGNLIALGIGVLLLLSSADLIAWNLFWKLAVTLVFILVGLGIMFRGFRDPIINRPVSLPSDGKRPSIFAIFSGVSPNYSNMEFPGSDCYAIFGGVELNLRDAVITQDCVIDCYTIFGGADIFLPPNVKAKVSTMPIFGGASNRFVASQDENAPTVHIRATCVFGGLEIK